MAATQGLQYPGLVKSKSWTFSTLTTGAIGAHTLATVSGLVAVRVVAFCGTTIVGAGTVEVGIAGGTALLLGQVANATTIAAGEIYHDATVDAQIEASTVLDAKSITTQNIILTIGTAALSAGELTFVVLWSPLSEDGNLEMSTPA